MEQQNTGGPLFQLNLDAQNSYTLRSAASWAKVFGVVGIIIGILCVIGAILFQSAMNQYDGGGMYESRSMRMMGNAGMVVYIIMGIIMIMSSIFALNFANNTQRALRANDQASLSGGFAGVRNYFALWAILQILMLLLMLIGILGNLGK